jgi:hypothetical protein
MRDLRRWWSLGVVTDFFDTGPGGEVVGGLREVAAPFVVSGPSGVAIRTRLGGLSAGDEKVLRLVGDLLGSLASRDLKARCAAGLEHGSERWAGRKRTLTQESSSRWAGSITKTTHDLWALALRGQLAHIQSLEAGIATITHRLSLPVGRKAASALRAATAASRSGSPSPVACNCSKTGCRQRGPTVRPGSCTWCVAGSGC